jgi:hypothetical protein
MLKVQAVLHDGSLALEFMTDDIAEAEEMRVQFLDFNRAAEVRVLDSRDGLQCEADVCKRNRPEIPRAQNLRTHCSSFTRNKKGRNSHRATPCEIMSSSMIIRPSSHQSVYR